MSFYFADTNWLEAIYFGVPRRPVVERWMRKHASALGVSPIVVLEARNVFTRVSGLSEPPEWTLFTEDSRFYHDPINWDLLQRDVFALISHYGHKETLGTFDLAVLASSKLGGATGLLTFDSILGALSVVEGLDVFPPLDDNGKAVLAKLRR